MFHILSESYSTCSQICLGSQNTMVITYPTSTARWWLSFVNSSSRQFFHVHIRNIHIFVMKQDHVGLMKSQQPHFSAKTLSTVQWRPVQHITVHHKPQYSVVQYSTPQQSIVQYSTEIQHSTVASSTAHHSAPQAPVQCSAAQYTTVEHSTE